MRKNSNSAKTRLATSFWLAFVLAGLLLVGVPHPGVAAQSATPSDDEVNRIAHQLYCPVCENTPLDVCPTEACRQWRDLIRQKLSEGLSEAGIKQYFVDQYGARVLAEPPRAGLNWLVYVLPPIIILAGALFLLRAMRAWTRPPTDLGRGAADTERAGSGVPSEPDTYVARLEDELRRRD
jgi:cytochrome c-type biogenesis protein CcmH